MARPTTRSSISAAPQHDKIDLRPIDADTGSRGNQTFTFIGDAQFTGAGQLRYEATVDGDFLVTGTRRPRPRLPTSPSSCAPASPA